MKILKVICIVDKDRRFTFDDITLINLIKMIIEAANIGNIGLRIYKNNRMHSKRKWNIRFFISQFIKCILSFADDT